MTKEQFFGMYLGQKFLMGVDGVETINSVEDLAYQIDNWSICEMDGAIPIKPILRPLSSMTDEEKEKLNEICEDGKCAMEGIDIELTSKNKRVGRNGKYRVNVFVPHKKIFYYLISIGVNIFEGVVPEDWYTYEKGESE